MKQKKIIFFIPRLPGYFLYNLEYLSKNLNTKLFVYHYKNDEDAPYELELSEDIQFKSIEKYTKKEIISQSISIYPDMVVISGWNNRLFRTLGSVFKKRKIPVVMPIDNLWKSSLKQYLFWSFGYRFIKSFADFIWVPGYPQYYYAKKLGFKDAEVLFNCYNGNYLGKNELAENYFSIKEKSFPKTIVFVGRFVDYKYPHLLAEVFDEIQSNKSNDWKLILIGNGKLKAKISKIPNDNIIIKEFMQPKVLNDFIAKQGVFCLPSHNEHWGLVVHEAASVGLPLILSDTVGACSTFLINGYNGYKFRSKDKEELKERLLAIMNKSDSQLLEMSKRSLEMSKKINCNIWSSSLLSIIS